MKKGSGEQPIQVLFQRSTAVNSLFMASRASDKEQLIGENDTIIIIKATLLCR